MFFTFRKYFHSSYFYFLFALFMIGALSGCTAERPRESSGFPQDDWGREVRLSAPAQRVVSIGPGATEAIFALGAQERLVGRDQFSNYPQEALSLPEVADYTGPFIEKVVALNPDLILVQGETYDAERADNWQQKIGAPVAVLVPKTLEDTREGIRKIAAWLDAPENLDAVTDRFEIIPDESAPQREVFFELERSPLWTAGSGTLIDDQLQLLGWKNIAGELQGYKAFNAEVLLQRDPDFYIVAMEKPDRQRALEELRKAPTLKNLSAVKKGHVLVVEADLVSRPGPRLPDGVQALKKEAASLESTSH